MSVLAVTDLRVVYNIRGRRVRAVDGVSFTVEAGEYFGLVGESGCGKTTLARAILRLLPANCRIMAGSICFNGRDITRLSDRELRDVRWRGIAFVPQSAMNSLDPVVRVGDQIAEAIRAHESVTKTAALRRAADLFGMVGLDARRLRDYPHQFSGGMRQRVLIAMSLALTPDLIVADEPTTALDVIVKDQILHRMEQVQKQLGKSLLLVTHDISVVAENCNRVAVMYAGRLMEYAPTRALIDTPFHPYTLGLKNAFPTLSGELRGLVSIPGAPPDLAEPPSGCRFHPRCPFATQRCITEEPPLLKVGPQHFTACHYPERAAEFRVQVTRPEVWQAARAAESGAA
jgi:oligopeptide/dipeptide ABC transporter ATP-binding protein